jgi:hypothetical protein
MLEIPMHMLIPLIQDGTSSLNMTLVTLSMREEKFWLLNPNRTLKEDKLLEKRRLEVFTNNGISFTTSTSQNPKQDTPEFGVCISTDHSISSLLCKATDILIPLETKWLSRLQTEELPKSSSSITRPELSEVRITTMPLIAETLKYTNTVLTATGTNYSDSTKVNS